MWKSLHPGDKVVAGDIIRYRPGTPRLIAPQDTVYEVVKAEQHYFEVVLGAEREPDEDPARKIIRYMDVGYHIHLEVWYGVIPLSPESRKEQTNLSRLK